MTQAEGGAEFEGSLSDLWRANLWSRVASRILLRVGEFEATTFPALERELRRLPWAAWLPGGARVRYKVAKRRTPLFHTGKVAEVAAEALSRFAGGQDAGDEAAFEIYLRLDGSRVTASLDTSGEHLHRRGYRTEAGPAPLRENLAAGLLLRSAWDGSEPLLDPFCGSGTFPIEAALLALRIPPGGGRAFKFEEFVSFDPVEWNSLMEEASSAVLRRLPAPVFGADRNPTAVALAARSARRAGLADHVQIAVADLADLEPPAEKGLLVANPPYGLRLPGEREARRILREALGSAFRRWRWGVVAAAGSRGEAPASGLPVSSRKTFRNGGLRLEWVQGRPAEECVLGKRGS